MSNINEIMKQLAEYQRIQEETTAIIDGLKDQIKGYIIQFHNVLIMRSLLGIGSLRD